MTNLAKMPACNALVVGAVKKTLSGFSQANILPHTGYIYYTEIVQSTPPVSKTHRQIMQYYYNTWFCYTIQYYYNTCVHYAVGYTIQYNSNKLNMFMIGIDVNKVDIRCLLRSLHISDS